MQSIQILAPRLSLGARFTRLSLGYFWSFIPLGVMTKSLRDGVYSLSFPISLLLATRLVVWRRAIPQPRGYSYHKTRVLPMFLVGGESRTGYKTKQDYLAVGHNALAA